MTDTPTPTLSHRALKKQVKLLSKGTVSAISAADHFIIQPSDFGTFFVVAVVHGVYSYFWAKSPSRLLEFRQLQDAKTFIDLVSFNPSQFVLVSE